MPLHSSKLQDELPSMTKVGLNYLVLMKLFYLKWMFSKNNLEKAKIS